MIDKHGRKIDHLRISVTQRCNLKCEYCHHEGELNPGKEVSEHEIKRIVKTLARFGIKKVKITGGEPLIRKDILQIVRNISSIKDIEEISMTTNGFLLEKLAAKLKIAGLTRVNIGCDSLTSVLPKNIEKVRNAIRAAKKVGLNPIKINMVVLKEINDKEIEKMISFAKENQVILQLIELINIDTDFYKKHYFPLDNIEKKFEKKASAVITRKMHARKQYFMDNIIIEVVKPYKEDFCKNCTKIRVTSDGKIKPCLMINNNLTIFKNKSSIKKALETRCVYADD
ncbi:MAG: GTP 3',8-cyclase MoaA [Nanoarchaeota archaeon]|nr:GTP 3',8-cyclase MoaA [Nanoarchaeota archaeon]MBU1321937.1 GTP 3',8-cyclase MoaA [Nanoarchaeota archaeon]MBU1597933.1 GTP 3',8-cyclase MoaA [Nanoarchaeota archaeon]MBU2441141.1 GTP 3',8-cyclase MoaA [Nanoarchaeota archaeon]